MTWHFALSCMELQGRPSPPVILAPPQTILDVFNCVLWLILLGALARARHAHEVISEYTCHRLPSQTFSTVTYLKSTIAMIMITSQHHQTRSSRPKLRCASSIGPTKASLAFKVEMVRECIAEVHSCLIMDTATTNIKPLRGPTTIDHIDSSHIPDDDERHFPPTEPPSALATPMRRPSHDGSNRTSNATFVDGINLGEAEKAARRKPSDQVNNQLPAEERQWADDIVTFDSKTDTDNPKNWPFRRKVIVTMLFGFTTMCSTFASSVFSPATSYVARQYGVSTEVAILGLSLFIAGYIPGRVVFAPVSEMYGRRISVLVPMFIFICLSAATATAENLQTIFITRFFAGFCASSPVATVGGGLADLFDQKERGTAVVFYSLAVVSGPTLGPIIGGAVSQSYLGWRWTEYLTVILTSVIILCDLIFLPETFAPVLLTRKARRLRRKTGRWALHSKHETQDFTLRTFLDKNLLRPIKMIVFEPMVFFITLYNSFVYGVLYLLFAAVPIIYEQNRGWNTLVGSLPFLAVLVGTFIAAGINIVYSQHFFAPLVERYGRVEPERRLIPMMVGSISFPIGFFLLGWTARTSINWFPSVLGLVFVGTSFLLIFQAGINYLIDAYTVYSASAVAANTFLRSFFAAGLPLIAQPMFRGLGIDWACTLLGCIGVLLAIVPFLFFKYGKALRARSKLAADDL